MFKKVKVFGGSAALTVEQTNTKSDLLTLNMDVALKKNQSFDWSDKITLQLSEDELPELCALCMGYRDQLILKRGNKGIELVKQDNHIYLKATRQSNGMSGANLFALPLNKSSIFRLNVIILETLKLQTGCQDSIIVISALNAFKR